MSDTVDVETLRRYLRDTETKIEELQREKADLLKRIAALTLSSTDATQTVDERFKLWLEYGVKDEYRFVERVRTTSGKELIQCLFPDKQRYQRIDIESLVEILDWLQEDLTNSVTYCFIKKHQITLNDISEWKEELMRLNFGSSQLDW